MTTSSKLSKSWPPIAHAILLDAARSYYREMKEPWPVPDVIMDRVIEQVHEEIDRRHDEIYDEASSGWIDRWESGTLDAEMRNAIEETYRQLSNAEGSIRVHARKSPRQLDIEIANALAAKRR